jgi:EAL domain-containing protein (putative c-di-GMP-specific phosphodiesterase class I)
VGFALLHRDPKLRSERAIHRALDEALFMSRTKRRWEDEAHARWLDGFIESGATTTLLQPIVDIATLEVLAHEAVLRGPAGHLFERAEALWALAERTGRAQTLERVFRRCAFERFRDLPTRRRLFITLGGTGAHEPDLLREGIAAELVAAGLTRAECVPCVSERLAALDRRAFAEALRTLKAQGFKIAIDDMGAGYSSLQFIAEMEPDYLRFDMSLVRHLERSPIKRSLLETIVQLSKKVQAPVIAHGLGTPEELAVVRELGVPLGQGPALGAHP